MSALLPVVATLFVAWGVLFTVTIPPGTGRHRRPPTTWDKVTTWLDHPRLPQTARFLSVGGPA